MENIVTKTEAKSCNRCGAQVRTDAKFCLTCGQPVMMTEDETQFVVSEMQPKRSGKKLWVILSSIVVVIAVLIICISAKPAYEKAFDTFATVYFEGDFSNIQEVFPLQMWKKCDGGLNLAAELASNPYYGQRWIEDNKEVISSWSILGTTKLDSTVLNALGDTLYSKTKIRMDYDEAYALQVHIEGTVMQYGIPMEKSKEKTYYAVKVSGEWYIVHYSGYSYEDLILGKYGNQTNSRAYFAADDIIDQYY